MLGADRCACGSRVAFGAYLSAKAFWLVPFFTGRERDPGSGSGKDAEKAAYEKGNAALYGYLYSAMPISLQTHAATHYQFQGIRFMEYLQNRFGKTQKRDLTAVLRDISKVVVKPNAPMTVHILDAQ